MIASSLGVAKLAALFVTLSCKPVYLDGAPFQNCDEEVTQSWIDPTPDELARCSRLASEARGRGERSWCEVLPADDLGVEPSAAHDVPAAPVAARFTF